MKFLYLKFIIESEEINYLCNRPALLQLYRKTYLGWKFPPQKGFTLSDAHTPKRLKPIGPKLMGSTSLEKVEVKHKREMDATTNAPENFNLASSLRTASLHPSNFLLHSTYCIWGFATAHNLENTSENVAVLDIKSSLTQGPNRVTKYTTRRFFLLLCILFNCSFYLSFSLLWLIYH